MTITQSELKELDTCKCKLRDRNEGENQRDWIKDCMCMFHWMQTDYYRSKLLNEVYKDTNYEPN